MSNKTWSIIDTICDFIFVVCGILGFTMNLAHIDTLVTNHFTWFVLMNVTYIVIFVLGWRGLSNREEEDS
jgi:hypothetical protein